MTEGSGLVIAYSLAAILASALGTVELISQLRTRATLREGAWLWWVIRLLADALAGVLAAALLLALVPDDWSPWVTGLVAGGSAATLLRQQFTTVGGTPVGIAIAYDYIRDLLDGAIDKCGSENDSKWVNEEFVPALLDAGASPNDVGKRLALYVKGLTKMDDSDRLDWQKTISDTVRDDTTDTRSKLEALVGIGLQLRAFRTLKNLHEHAKEVIEQRT
jgi:hypothetical protein